MARKSYLNANNIVKLCRVCLTHCNNVMYDLTDDMDLDGTQGISILDSLEKVVHVKVLLNEEFPQCICPMCISMLKMIFKFIRQFEETQKTLKNTFGKTPTYELHEQDNAQEIKKENVNVIENTDDTAPVEIIFGANKFNLKDVFVIEEAQTEKCSFRGFLENLGNEVTATFVDKSKSVSNAEQQTEDAVSIYMTDSANGILPVRELKIDDDTNAIDYILVEQSQLDLEGSIEGIKNEIEENSEENDRIEYIEIETLNDDIESLIMEASENDGEINKENNIVDQPRVKKVIKVGKRKKLIKERKSMGMIIMEPVDDEEEVEVKVEENEDDIFEREIQFPCEICKKIFPTSKSLKAHKKRTHFPKERQYTCEVCGYKNNTRSGYMHHKVKHIGKQFVCEICSKTYYTRAVLKVHMATHVNKRQHLCNVCGKGFNYANALIYHMRLHTGERNYKCDYCGEKFRMPNALKRHERIHTGERPYKCRFCDRGFCSRGEVQCHENIHTGYRPYHCKHCRKGFTKTHNLKLHLLSHDGPHKCDFCGKSFIEMSILSMHYKISHKDLIEKGEEEEEETKA